MYSKYIWIRHADKKFDNGKAIDGYCQHDSPIKDDINEEIYDKVNLLVEKYGFPTHIIYSPFLRTRQTKDYMLIKLKEIDEILSEKIEINHDLNISEFLGFQKPIGVPAKVEEETQLYFKQTILLGESLKNLNLRVMNHIYDLNIFDTKKEKCIWIITHGIIISNIYHNLYKIKNIKQDLKTRPKSLSYLCFKFNLEDHSSIIDDSDL
jgi:broad specificity phosphatase PhoE